MSTNASIVDGYLKNALLQLGAESYLHGIVLSDPVAVAARLQYGFNDPTHPFIDPTAITNGRGGRAAPNPNDPTEPFGPNKPVLPGANRMVASQAIGLLNEYVVVDQHANDATGFSSTLWRNKNTGEYTLSFRSTEFRTWSTAGDNERDNEGANKGGIVDTGFAMAQLGALKGPGSNNF